MDDTKVIVISGPQGSGKSTLTEAIRQAFGGSCAVLKFADPLYGLQKLVHDYVRLYCGLEPLKEGEVKDRFLLQWLGTEWGQGRWGSTVWSEVWERRLCRMDVHCIVTDDMRFPHELEAAKRMGAVLIRLKCDEETRRARIGTNFGGTTHPSETALDGTPDAEFAFTFDTSCTSVDEMLGTLRAAGVLDAEDEKQAS